MAEQDPLLPVVWSASLPIGFKQRSIVRFGDGTVGLFVGNPGKMHQKGYRVSFDRAIGRARDICAGKMPENYEQALVTLAAVIIALVTPVDDIRGYVALKTLHAGDDDADAA
jgi:hypothetical protein